MREKELRTLARKHPAEFRWYVACLKGERERKLKIVRIAGRICSTAIWILVSLVVSLVFFIAGLVDCHDEEGLSCMGTMLGAIAVVACVGVVAFAVDHIFEQRAHRTDSEIALADSIAGTPT